MGIGAARGPLAMTVAMPPVYQAIVKGTTVYAGDDVELAMATFEAFADHAATMAGAHMITYVMPPAATRHIVPGYENRPVVEAHAMANSVHFVGCLYGVSREQWQGRVRLP